MKEEEAFEYLKEEFKGWDFVSKDLAHAKAHIDDKGGWQIPPALFRVHHTDEPIKTAEAILRVGGDVDATNWIGTALHFYIRLGKSDIVEWLINNGANVNAIEKYICDSTPLMLLMQFGGDKDSLEIILKKLLVKGADPLIEDQLGRNAIRVGRDNGFESCAVLMEEAVKERKMKKEQDAFEVLKEAYWRWDFVSRDLEYAKAKVNALDATHNKYPFFEITIGGYSLDFEERTLKNAEALLVIGANIDIEKDSQTPLCYFLQRRLVFVASWLIEHGANVNFQDSLGRTPLRILVSHSGEASTLKKLLERKADPTICDKEGNNAIDVAERNSKHGFLHYLREAVPTARVETPASEKVVGFSSHIS